MKLPFARLQRRLAWLNLPTVSLLALLQRTPLPPLAATAENLVVRSPLGLVLKSALAVAASMGTVHTLAGATTLTATTKSPLAATVGTAIAQVALGVSGTQTQPKSFTVSGSIPAGLTLATSSTSVTSTTALPATINGSTLSLSGTPTTAGTYDIGLVAHDGTNGGGEFSSPTLTYRVVVTGASATAPAFTTQPKSQTIAAGKSVTFTVVASGSPAPTLQWKKGTTVLTGKTAASLTLSALKEADAGSYTCVATNSAGSVTSSAATLTVKTVPAKPASFGAFASGKTAVALSWAAAAATTAGTPTGYKLERATNTAFTTGAKTFSLGTATSYVDTSLTAGTTYYYRLSAVTIAGNSTATATVSVKTLSTVATGTGRIPQVIARVYCGTGANVATGGFAVGAGAPKKVLLRAVGPTLTAVGVSASSLLKDPVLELSDSSTKALIATNDNWKTNANATQISSAVTTVGGTPFLSTDTTSSALWLTLPPGTYTFTVSGKSSTSGIVLIELYDLD
jgi:hypothetical protein